MNKRFKNSAAVVFASFIGAFASRYVDKSLGLPKPYDLIALLISMVFLLAVCYFLLGRYFE